MKKIIIILLSIILLASVACANNDHKLTLKVNDTKVILDCSDDYILRSGLFSNDTVSFSVFNKDKENFGVGYLIDNSQFYDEFKQMILNDETCTIFENTDSLLYYSCQNDEDKDATEYNRVIKIDNNRALILASFDKEKIDEFYKVLSFTIK